MAPLNIKTTMAAQPLPSRIPGRLGNEIPNRAPRDLIGPSLGIPNTRGQVARRARNQGYRRQHTAARLGINMRSAQYRMLSQCPFWRIPTVLKLTL